MTIPVTAPVFGFDYHVDPYTGWPVANYPPAQAPGTGALMRFDTPQVRLPGGPQPTWSFGRVPAVTPLPPAVRFLPGTPGGR